MKNNNLPFSFIFVSSPESSSRFQFPRKKIEKKKWCLLVARVSRSIMSASGSFLRLNLGTDVPSGALAVHLFQKRQLLRQKEAIVGCFKAEAPIRDILTELEGKGVLSANEIIDSFLSTLRYAHTDVKFRHIFAHVNAEGKEVFERTPEELQALEPFLFSRLVNAKSFLLQQLFPTSNKRDLRDPISSSNEEAPDLCYSTYHPDYKNGAADVFIEQEPLPLTSESCLHSPSSLQSRLLNCQLDLIALTDRELSKYDDETDLPIDVLTLIPEDSNWCQFWKESVSTGDIFDLDDDRSIRNCKSFMYDAESQLLYRLPGEYGTIIPAVFAKLSLPRLSHLFSVEGFLTLNVDCSILPHDCDMFRFIETHVIPAVRSGCVTRDWPEVTPDTPFSQLFLKVSENALRIETTSSSNKQSREHEVWKHIWGTKLAPIEQVLGIN